MWIVFWAFIYLFLAIGAHALLSRLKFVANSVIRFVLTGGILGLVLSVHMCAIYGLTLSSLASLVLYAFVCELYIFLFTLVMSGISARLLIILLTNPLTLEELEAVYNTTGMVEWRLKRLLLEGLLERGENQWRLSKKGLWLMQFFVSLKRFFGHENL